MNEKRTEQKAVAAGVANIANKINSLIAEGWRVVSIASTSEGFLAMLERPIADMNKEGNGGVLSH